MPDIYRVKLTTRAAKHLHDAFDYIEKDSPQNASRMIQRLVDSIDDLEIFPHRFRVLEDSVVFGADVRSMPVPPYLVRYHVDNSTRIVTILSIRHGARRPGL